MGMSGSYLERNGQLGRLDGPDIPPERTLGSFFASTIELFVKEKGSQPLTIYPLSLEWDKENLH